MITNKNETKTMIKYISCDGKFKFNCTTCNSNQKRKYRSWYTTSRGGPLMVIFWPRRLEP